MVDKNLNKKKTEPQMTNIQVQNWIMLAVLLKYTPVTQSILCLIILFNDI